MKALWGGGGAIVRQSKRMGGDILNPGGGSGRAWSIYCGIVDLF